ncbi:MAG: hypothetical protein J3Q66DRAFT_375279 [Benniella sp.]|nr:MAG: hypothetical protein J3Q66DRAFT_375279 [Benniella sp.]
MLFSAFLSSPSANCLSLVPPTGQGIKAEFTPRNFSSAFACQVAKRSASSICTIQQSQANLPTVNVALTKGLAPPNLSSRTAELARKPDALVAHLHTISSSCSSLCTREVKSPCPASLLCRQWGVLVLSMPSTLAFTTVLASLMVQRSTFFLQTVP